MKTIYMDVTSLLAFPTMTGIQRVVSEIAIHLAAKQESRGYELVLLRHNRDYNFTVCDNDKFMTYFLLSKGRKLDCITPNTITIDQMAPSSFWLDADGVWVSMIPRHILYPQLAKRNIQIGVYVYDVITISHPQYCAAENHVRFPAYLGAVYDYADFIFTETQYTREQVRQIASEIGCDREIQYRLAVPGSDFSGGVTENIQISEKVREIAERGKILLTVSTLEIRKNHKVLLDAFDAGLCEMGYQMVFVGKCGWKVDELMERIESHPENGNSLFHLQGINDATLHFLYQNASFVLFPSYIEGYGLATVEALRFGVPAILSDVPVMREVGRDYCDYFEPDSPDQLINIIGRYDADPASYDAKKERIKNYCPPTWDACAESIADAILQFRRPPVETHTVEQIVYLSARSDAMRHTLEFVEHFMPFIKRALILCPDGMADKMSRQYQGGLEITCITDSQLLNGRTLPEDHTCRNFLLRCLAMSRPELDDEFIMSDDDYRPLVEVDLSFFVREGRFQAFYFYDLDEWADVVRDPTSYDYSMLRTNAFLKQNGYPNLQYASHMPQIIRKKWYLDMLKEHPGLEETGCDEWSTYFNYSIKHHPEAFDVRPYTTLSWPEMITSWYPMVEPPRYVFENFYDFLYEEGQLFSGLHTTYQDTTYLENVKKILINDLNMQRGAAVRKQWRAFENKCNRTWKQFPSFVFCFGRNLKPEFRNLPAHLELLNGSAYSFPVSIMEKDESGLWNPSSANLRIGYRWSESDKIIISENINGRGRATIKIGTPGEVSSTWLKLYYSFDEQEFILACKIPVRFSKGNAKSPAPKARPTKQVSLSKSLPVQLDLSQMENALAYINHNYEVPYYWALGPKSLKTLIKRLVRKIVKCIIPPILEKQNRINKNIALSLNQLSAFSKENALETELYRQELDTLQEETARLRQIVERLEKNAPYCSPSIETRFPQISEISEGSIPAEMQEKVLK